MDEGFDRVAQATACFDDFTEGISEALVRGMIPLWYAKTMTTVFYQGITSALDDNEVERFLNDIEESLMQDLSQLQTLLGQTQQEQGRQKFEQSFLSS